MIRIRVPVLASVLLALPALAGSDPTTGPVPERDPEVSPLAAVGIAPGIYLLSGQIVPGDQPDGNSVVLRGSEGLVVVDVGRHVEHTRRIVDFARQLRQPVKVVVNTHWHLDHTGGNPLMREEFPGLEIVGGGAFEEAMTGFLATYRRQLSEAIASAETPATGVERYRKELAILDRGQQLLPDIVVTESGEHKLSGRLLDIHLETFAVSGGDLWLRDPQTRTVIAGDLVTMPVPLFDTACPERWQAALDRLARADWVTLVPGHGAPMNRAAFAEYRAAFDDLLACAASTEPKETCIDGWLHKARDLVVEGDQQLARDMLGYYIEQLLRAPTEPTRPLCGAP